MVTYFKKHKNHLSAIIAPMLKQFIQKTMNNFLYNAEHKIILCRILEIVYAKNSEQFS